MTAGEAGQWCRRCHHMIVPDRATGKWQHVSDDDWAGPGGECPCAYQLTPCVPQERLARLLPGVKVNSV